VLLAEIQVFCQPLQGDRRIDAVQPFHRVEDTIQMRRCVQQGSKMGIQQRRLCGEARRSIERFDQLAHCLAAPQTIRFDKNIGEVVYRCARERRQPARFEAHRDIARRAKLLE
jgi:hypothetical protein